MSRAELVVFPVRLHKVNDYLYEAETEICVVKGYEVTRTNIPEWLWHLLSFYNRAKVRVTRYVIDHVDLWDKYGVHVPITYILKVGKVIIIAHTWLKEAYIIIGNRTLEAIKIPYKTALEAIRNLSTTDRVKFVRIPTIVN